MMSPSFRFGMNNRGIFLSIISILLVSGLFFVYLAKTRVSPLQDTRVVEIRVLTLDSQIGDIESDLERGLHISAVRSLLGIMEHLSRNGTYVSNFPLAFQEAVLLGTVQGAMLNLTINSTLLDWANKVETVAKKLDVNVSIGVSEVRIAHTSPWIVKVTLFGELNATASVASWQRVLNISTDISIIGLEDPLYVISSKGKFSNIIAETNLSMSLIATDPATLVVFANTSQYLTTPPSPSYLMRFEGNFSISPYGIQSIVNMEKLQAAAPSVVQSSVSSVDFVQFGLGLTGCSVNKTPELPWFKVDTLNAGIYGVPCP